MYYVKQLNNGYWYVVASNASLPDLRCMNGGFRRRADAAKAMKAETNLHSVVARP